MQNLRKIIWWTNNISDYFAPCNIPDPGITVNVDASLTGRGITDGKTLSWGKWDENEITHTNVLELKAIQFSVLTYCKDKNLNHIKIMSENITVIYIKKKRGLKSHECNKIAKEI